MQAGPPAIFEASEYLSLSFDSFETGSADPYAPSALLARMAISHPMSAPSHTTSMGDDDSQVFQNIVISITRMESSMPHSRTLNPRTMGYSRWTNWELARENDRIWRHWWDDAPPTPASSSSSCSSSTSSSSSSFPAGADAAPIIDSGFEEATILGMMSPGGRSEGATSILKTCTQSLSIGKMIHSAQIELTCTKVHANDANDVDMDDGSPYRLPLGRSSIQHEYRWRSVDLDAFKVIIAHEERTRRTGMSAVFATNMIVF